VERGRKVGQIEVPAVRTAGLAGTTGVKQMTYKTVLVSLNDTARVPALLEAACRIASQNDAHVIGLYVIPAARIYPEMDIAMVPTIFDAHRKKFEAERETVRHAFEERTRRDGISAAWECFDSGSSEVTEGTLEHARLADLVILSQIDAKGDGCIEPELVERIIMECGRPVLVVPQKARFNGSGQGIASRIVVGVNATRESTRAMFDALPLLQSADETRLVWVDPYRSSGETGAVPGADEAAVLARHGVKAISEPMLTNGTNPGEALLTRTTDTGAGLLVMGAYAHSRMREYIFGGATRHVLEHMTVPVLMSH
jgi:nucleotide-binding universal stress UspA family protein